MRVLPWSIVGIAVFDPGREHEVGDDLVSRRLRQPAKGTSASPRTPGVTINNPPAFGCISSALSSSPMLAELMYSRSRSRPPNAQLVGRCDRNLQCLRSTRPTANSGARTSRPRMRSTGSLRNRRSSRRDSRRRSPNCRKVAAVCRRAARVHVEGIGHLPRANRCDT